jgi:hypothetical protein
MPSTCFGLWLATLRHQSTAWRFRSSKSSKLRPGRKFVSTYACERTLDPAFAFRVSHPVRAEPETKGAGEGGHLRRDDGLGTGAGGEQDAGVVDDAGWTDTMHETNCIEQERLGPSCSEAGYDGMWTQCARPSLLFKRYGHGSGVQTPASGSGQRRQGQPRSPRSLRDRRASPITRLYRPIDASTLARRL